MFTTQPRVISSQIYHHFSSNFLTEWEANFTVDPWCQMKTDVLITSRGSSWIKNVQQFPVLLVKYSPNILMIFFYFFLLPKYSNLLRLDNDETDNYNIITSFWEEDWSYILWCGRKIRVTKGVEIVTFCSLFGIWFSEGFVGVNWDISHTT